MPLTPTHRTTPPIWMGRIQLENNEKKEKMNYHNLGLAPTQFFNNNGQFTVIETVTPLIAKSFLSRGNGNLGRYKKPFIESVVENYARDMSAGNWRLTHQGIAFDVNGNLVDGYNRLHAVIRSGATIQLAVTYNMTEDAIKYLDSGKLRTNSDKLRVPKRLAHALRFAAKNAFKQRVPSVKELEGLLASPYGEMLNKIIEKTPTNYRLITSSPVTCGVAFCAIDSKDTYPVDQYLALYSQNYLEMSTLVQCFAKQINRGQFSATDHADLLARTVYVFTPSNRNKTQTGRLNERVVKTMFNELLNLENL